jgi:hypothetical protein
MVQRISNDFFGTHRIIGHIVFVLIYAFQYVVLFSLNCFKIAK